MGDIGANAFSNVLLRNVTLVSLNLAGNRITNEGVYVLCHALEKNITLKKLMLDHNQIGEGPSPTALFRPEAKSSTDVCLLQTGAGRSHLH